MPIIKSAKKELRKSKKRSVKNLRVKKSISRLIKEIRKLAQEKKEKEARELFLKLQKAADKAAIRHIIHKNRASRIKSRLQKAIQKIKQEKK